MGLTQEFEMQYWSLDKYVLGLDEAGRRPMAGPCVVCGVVFEKGYDHPEINDSKQMSDTKRRKLVDIIKRDAIYYFVEIIDVETIDSKNIYASVQDAMRDIAKKANVDVVLTDAMPIEVDTKEVVSIVKGDARSLSIAAASILAKTIRDDIMIELDGLYPEYGFKNHKGYGTKAHKQAIIKHGRCPAHRMSFRFKDEVQISLDI